MDTETRCKNLYQWFKQKDELHQLLPKATGEWEKDKKGFIKIQQEIENLANLTDLDLE